MDQSYRVVPYSVSSDTEPLLSYYPLPGFGFVPVNAFLIRADEPVLVDTGIVSEGTAFMDALRSIIALEEIRWLWLTHADPDHVGSVAEILSEAPHARVVTTFLGMGKMLLLGLPPDRVYLLNPGQSLDVGDRQLQAVKPPTFDAPESTGFFDTRTETLFSVDAFGAVLSEPAETAAGIRPSDLREGLITWTTIDVPWLAGLSERTFAESLDRVRKLEPRVILSSHLPPATGMNEALFDYLAAAREATPFVGPDQAAMERMMAGMQGPGAP
jgi:flavorubredoxin